jgi:hypothetical protein
MRQCKACLRVFVAFSVAGICRASAKGCMVLNIQPNPRSALIMAAAKPSMDNTSLLFGIL